MLNLHIPRCQHLKSNGAPCAAPALRGENICYFHARAREIALHNLPILEDYNSIQLALMRVIAGILDQSLDPKRAGLVIYALQTAASNLRGVKSDPSFEIMMKETKSFLPVPAWSSAGKASQPPRSARKKPAQRASKSSLVSEKVSPDAANQDGRTS